MSTKFTAERGFQFAPKDRKTGPVRRKKIFQKQVFLAFVGLTSLLAISIVTFALNSHEFGAISHAGAEDRKNRYFNL